MSSIFLNIYQLGEVDWLITSVKEKRKLYSGRDIYKAPVLSELCAGLVAGRFREPVPLGTLSWRAIHSTPIRRCELSIRCALY